MKDRYGKEISPGDKCLRLISHNWCDKVTVASFTAQKVRVTDSDRPNSKTVACYPYSLVVIKHLEV